MTKKIKTAVIGASGYTGAELVRLLVSHDNVEIAALVAESNAGKSVSSLYSHLSHSQIMVKLHDVNWENIDVAFCCLPHATSQEIISNLVKQHKQLKVIDLSADFRLRNTSTYEKWYGKQHVAPDLQKEAVYGLTEIYRDKIKNARVVACPGCYPTSVLLPLIPLIKENVISPDRIIIDAKSGVSGAGRSAKVASLFTEVNENIKPYAIGNHRHLSEIEQELGATVTFTPQLVPMNRGILSVIYANLAKGHNIADAKKALTEKYKNDPFVNLSEEIPTVRMVTGSNFAKIGVFEDRISNSIIIISVIDNLIKGASGQAIQNMNVMFGFHEDQGLLQTPVFP